MESKKEKKKKISSGTERVEFVFHSHECNSECPLSAGSLSGTVTLFCYRIIVVRVRDTDPISLQRWK